MATIAVLEYQDYVIRTKVNEAILALGPCRAEASAKAQTRYSPCATLSNQEYIQKNNQPFAAFHLIPAAQMVKYLMSNKWKFCLLLDGFCSTNKTGIDKASFGIDSKYLPQTCKYPYKSKNIIMFTSTSIKVKPRS